MNKIKIQINTFNPLFGVSTSLLKRRNIFVSDKYLYKVDVVSKKKTTCKDTNNLHIYVLYNCENFYENIRSKFMYHMKTL